MTTPHPTTGRVSNDATNHVPGGTPCHALRGVALVVGLVACSGPSAAQPAGDPVTLTRVGGGLLRPTGIAHAGDGSGRLFVVEQAGRIRILEGGALRPVPFLDISSRVSCCGEQGLLSVAFPPGFAAKRHFYVDYTNTTGTTVVSRFRLTADPGVADPASEEVVLTVAQPFANHNGGQLAFGPDGYLYIGMGDGGSGGDPLNNAQSGTTLLGKLLRLDVESATQPYAVPASNPFRGNPNFRPEIWALGLRNPWRFSFDRSTGDLWIADVGQNAWEEVNVQPVASPGGENYGWRLMEGAHCYDPNPCSPTGLVLPVAEYDHSLGCSITGGFVARGPAPVRLAGAYVYGDFCSGRVWTVRPQGSSFVNELIITTPYGISAFGEDEAGSLYLADYGGGALYRFDAGECMLACTAVVPAAAERGATVSVAATAEPTSCASSPTWDWDFGDGGPHAATPTASHAWANRGTYTWRLTATAGTTTCTRTGTIVVGAAPRRTLTAH
ncbi:MAG: PQQ-dependent sugar dehydrogenase [Acidobacteria bacterium]|nr:PQQ-dependent sugar dehydrogenase [Acidobacteriota bacterium]